MFNFSNWAIYTQLKCLIWVLGLLHFPMRKTCCLPPEKGKNFQMRRTLFFWERKRKPLLFFSEQKEPCSFCLGKKNKLFHFLKHGLFIDKQTKKKAVCTFSASELHFFFLRNVEKINLLFHEWGELAIFIVGRLS